MLRRALSKCIEQIMTNIGSKNINVMPGHVQKQLFKMLSYYINDSNQEVRINAKKALLTI